MDTEEKIMYTFFGIGTLAILLLVVGLFYFSSLEAKRKDRELTIREREIELKAEQYPYKSEMKLEVVHE